MPSRGSILVVLGAALATAAVVFVWQATGDAVYESESLVAVDAPAILDAAAGRPENTVFVARRYAARARIGPVVDAAAAASGLSPADVRDRTSVDVSNEDATMVLRARGGSAGEAASLATALTEALGDRIREEQLAIRGERLEPLEERIAAVAQELSRQRGESAARAASEREYGALVAERAAVEVEPLDRLYVLSPAQEPTASIAPRPLRDAAVAFLVALVVGAEVVVARRLYRRDRRTADDLTPAV